MAVTHLHFPRPQPTSVGHGLCRAVATLHEAVLNQELTSMQIASHRLRDYALRHGLGPVAWHARAIATLCTEAPNDLRRLAELIEGLDFSIERAIEGPGCKQ